MRGRLVTAQNDIQAGQMVLVELPSHFAQPARHRTHRLLPGNVWVVAKAQDAIQRGEQGLVDDVETASAATHSGGVSVIVVDDDRLTLKFVESVLGPAGYRVTVATSGDEALRLTQAHGRFDLFILDIKMPGMDGDDLARRLREIDPQVKVLYYTGYSDSLFQGDKALAPGEAFLDKPAEVKGLREAVSLILFDHVRGPEHKT